jgi:hypothetical protein
VRVTGDIRQQRSSRVLGSGAQRLVVRAMAARVARAV